MRLFSLIILALWNVSTASADVAISGKVLDEDGTPVVVNIEANNFQVKSNPNGSYISNVDKAKAYTFKFSAAGYYDSIQTFSDYELSTADKPYTIPTITLVHKKPNRTLFLFAGDFMMGRRFSKPFSGEPVLIHPNSILQDAKSILKTMKLYLEAADYAAVNLETQVMNSEPEEKAPKSVTFFTPPEALDALKWAGVDYVTLGNNHTYDYLDNGLKLTLTELDKRSIDYSGAGLTEDKALASHTIDRSGTTYAFQGYVGWAGSGRISQVAEGAEKGGPPIGTEQNIISSIKRDVQKGASPIVQYHGSLEYSEEPSLDTETRLKAAADAGASIIIGHHPHVFQGLEVYNGKLIAWSLGNFVFDQYFYTAQKSALLYVWMDGSQFHRAEVVPIYLKGYKPTPATGEMRNSILKRISNLSMRRGSLLMPNGGHAVLQTQGSQKLPTTEVALADFNVGIQTLQTQMRGPMVLMNEGASLKRFRLGKDLLSRGDFEAYSTFGAPDRSWIEVLDEVTIERGNAASGLHAMKLTLSNNRPVIAGMRKFTRDYKAGNPTSVIAKVKAEQDVELTFYMQRRKTRDGLSDALLENPKVPLATVRVRPGNWEHIEVPFDSPRVGTRSYRILFEARSLDNEVADVWVDDFALIEWQTPFYSGEKAEEIAVPIDASHIQVDAQKP